MKKELIRKALFAVTASALMFAYGAAEAHADWGSFGSRGGSWGGSRGASSGGGSFGGSRGRLFGGSRGGSSGGSFGGSRGGSSGGGSFGGSRGGSFGGSSGGSRGGLFRGGLLSRLGSRHGSSGGGSFGSRGGSRGGSSGGSSGGYSYYSGSHGGSSGGSHGGSHGYSMPVTTYSTPSYSQPVYSQPSYSQPVMSSQSMPVYNSAPAMASSYSVESYMPSMPSTSGVIIDNGGIINSTPYSGGATDGGSTVVPSPTSEPPTTPLDGSSPPPAPVDDSDETNTSSQEAVDGVEAEAEPDTTAQLNLKVPTAAVVYVNGRRTNTPGSLRSYVSRNLKPGKNYTYEVRAELKRNGKTLSRTKVVQLTAGTDKTFDMSFDQSEEMITSVTLFVPQDAVVSLGGVKTDKEGAMRYFSTATLKDGESWKSYRVSVSVERDGKTVTRNRVIDVNAGDSVNLRFDFDAGSQIASL